MIDISSFVKGEDSQLMEVAAAQIRDACTNHGFFYVKGHGVSEELQNKLDQLSRTFFSLPEVDKMKIEMAKGGKAWRGYFP